MNVTSFEEFLASCGRFRSFADKIYLPTTFSESGIVVTDKRRQPNNVGRWAWYFEVTHPCCGKSSWLHQRALVDRLRAKTTKCRNCTQAAIGRRRSEMVKKHGNKVKHTSRAVLEERERCQNFEWAHKLMTIGERDA